MKFTVCYIMVKSLLTYQQLRIDNNDIKGVETEPVKWEYIDKYIEAAWEFSGQTAIMIKNGKKLYVRETYDEVKSQILECNGKG